MKHPTEELFIPREKSRGFPACYTERQLIRKARDEARRLEVCAPDIPRTWDHAPFIYLARKELVILARMGGLSEREYRILACALAGWNHPAIARSEGVSVSMIRKLLTRIKNKIAKARACYPFAELCDIYRFEISRGLNSV